MDVLQVEKIKTAEALKSTLYISMIVPSALLFVKLQQRVFGASKPIFKVITLVALE